MALSNRVHIVASDEWLAIVEEWRRTQYPIPSQSAAIRELVERGLTVKTVPQTCPGGSNKVMKE